MAEIPTVLTSREACRVYGEAHVRWMLESGRWQRPSRGVVVRHSGVITFDERVKAELMLQGSNSALAGLTAATFDGLEGFSSTTLYLVAPHRERVRKRPGVVVKRSRQLGVADVHPARRPRRTRLPRSVVDAASWAGTDLRTQAIIAASVQQGLVQPSSLQAVVDRHPTLPRRGLIVETIGDVSGGSLSEYEVLFSRLCRREGFPEPSRQRRRKDASGRWRYFDAEFDEYELVVEIDGQQHMDAITWWEDMARNNELVVDDHKKLLRFAGFALRREPQRVAQVLHRFFDSH